MNWTELLISVNARYADAAADIAQMVVPYGIYIEDYSNLEKEAAQIAHIDLIDEELLKKDRTKCLIHIYISPEENPSEAAAFLSERYNSQGIEHKIETSLCKNEDWENNWKAFFKPFTVGERLFIKPIWEEADDIEGRKTLHIEPGLAFGTGSHNTTRLCLEAIENNIKGGESVLDIGCGSGILSVASLLLGAKSAIGVDIDALAVKTAVNNGRLNGFEEPELVFCESSLAQKVEGKFDLVLANIVADVIITLCADVCVLLNEGGVFIASGIIDTRENEVLEAFEKYGIETLKRHENGGWICFECRKKQD